MLPYYFLVVLIFHALYVAVESVKGKAESESEKPKSESATNDLLIKPPYYKSMAFVHNKNCYFTSDMKTAYLVESEEKNNYLNLYYHIVSLRDPEDPFKGVFDDKIAIRSDNWHLTKTICMDNQINGRYSLSYPPKGKYERELKGDAIPLVPDFKSGQSRKLKELPEKYIQAIKGVFEKLEMQSVFNALLERETYDMELMKDIPKTGKVSRADLTKHLKLIAAGNSADVQVKYGDKDGILWKMLVLYLYGSKFVKQSDGFIPRYRPPPEIPYYIEPKDVNIHEIKLNVYSESDLEHENVMKLFKDEIQEKITKSIESCMKDKDKKYTLNVQLICGVNKDDQGKQKVTCFEFKQRSDQVRCSGW